MLEKLQYKIGGWLMRLANEEINKGDFKHAMNGLKMLKAALYILPPSKEKTDFVDRVRALAESKMAMLNGEGA